jgi:hypothetical protein
VGGGFVRSWEPSEKFWRASPCKNGARDRVVVEGGAVRYLLWGHEIAAWYMDDDVLIVRDCGYRTMLTRCRLNYILGGIGWSVYSNRGRWFIAHQDGREYYWEGEHKIRIGAKTIEPHRPRIYRPSISLALKRFYMAARKVIERGYVAVPALDRKYYIFFFQSNSNISRRAYKSWRGTVMWPLLIVEICGVANAFFTKAPASTIYSAAAKRPERLLKCLKDSEGGWLAGVKDILYALEELGFTLANIPREVHDALAVTSVLSLGVEIWGA